MKKRGFTLIELLAVIIILAIIALIATPIIMKVIENSKKGASKASIENYLQAIETQVVAYRIDNEKVKDGTYSINSDGDVCLNESCDKKLEINMNGKKPDKGNIKIIGSKVDSYAVMIGDYDFSKDMLPFTYQQVEYIESTGKQYIRIDEFDFLELYNSDSTKLEAKVCIKGGYYLFNAGLFYDFGFGIKNESNGSLMWKAPYTYFGLIPPNVITEIKLEDSSSSSVTVTSSEGANQSVKYSKKEIEDNYPLVLFGRANSGTGDIELTSSAQIYYFSISIGNKDYINLIPCYRKSDNKPGMYDLVSGKFYTNQGSGDDFKVGDDI